MMCLFYAPLFTKTNESMSSDRKPKSSSDPLHPRPTRYDNPLDPLSPTFNPIQYQQQQQHRNSDHHPTSDLKLPTVPIISRFISMNRNSTQSLPALTGNNSPHNGDNNGNNDTNNNDNDKGIDDQKDDSQNNNPNKGNDDAGGKDDNDDDNANRNRQRTAPPFEQNFGEIQSWHLKIPEEKDYTDTVYHIITKCFAKMASSESIIFHPSNARTQPCPATFDSILNFLVKAADFSEFFWMKKIKKDGKKHKFDGAKVNIKIQCTI